MNAAYVTALAGSAIGELSSFATTWLTQSYQERAQRATASITPSRSFPKPPRLKRNGLSHASQGVGNWTRKPPLRGSLLQAILQQLSASIRFGRAKGRCEGCGRPHGKLVLCVSDGRWFDRQDGSWRDERGRRITRPRKPYRLRWTIVRLAACHLDHDPTNSDLENLAAWCQRCHLLHDRPEHRRRAAITVLQRRALGDLFLGSYRI